MLESKKKEILSSSLPYDEACPLRKEGHSKCMEMEWKTPEKLHSSSSTFISRPVTIGYQNFQDIAPLI